MDTSDQGPWLTLDEAAHRLNRSEKTLRRWIKAGRLAAELVDTDHGPAYRVRAEAVEEARRVVTVTTAERPPDAHALAAAIGQALAERDAQWTAAIGALREEVRQLREQLQASALGSPGLIPPPAPDVPAAPRRWSWRPSWLWLWRWPSKEPSG